MNEDSRGSEDSNERAERPWHPDDAAWMERKKADWQKIQKRLAGASMYVRRSTWKHLKAYYFFGTPMPQPARPQDYTFQELCRWWLHPVESELTEFKFAMGLTSLRGDFRYLYGSLAAAIEPEGDAEYGVMGGRELLINRAINPCLDNAEHIDLPGGTDGRCCERPRFLVPMCLSSTQREIRSYDLQPIDPNKKRDHAYIAYSPDLVLWDHLSAAMGKGEEVLRALEMEIDSSGKAVAHYKVNELSRMDRMFNETLMDVLTFFDRDEDNDSRQRPLTVQHVEYLLERYESGKFSDPLLHLWNRAKAMLE